MNRGKDQVITLPVELDEGGFGERPREAFWLARFPGRPCGVRPRRGASPGSAQTAAHQSAQPQEGLKQKSGGANPFDDETSNYASRRKHSSAESQDSITKRNPRKPPPSQHGETLGEVS